jgi:ATP-dependent DNA ligase
MRRLPTRVRLQIVSSVTEPPEGGAWAHEIKYDGYRIGVRL